MPEPGGPGGQLAPQYLADQLTLFRPGRADYPHQLQLAPPQCFSPSGITANHPPSLSTYFKCLFSELHDSILNQHHEVYIERLEVEATSGIFNVPLPPNLTGLNLICWSLVEIINNWKEEYQSYIRNLKLAISIVWLFMIFSINLVKLIITATIYDGIFLAKLIFDLIAIGVIKLIIQCLPRLVVRGVLD